MNGQTINKRYLLEEETLSSPILELESDKRLWGHVKLQIGASEIRQNSLSGPCPHGTVRFPSYKISVISPLPSSSFCDKQAE